MSIGYNLNIPNAPNNPSNDQPLMQANTNAISTFLGIDHVAFGANGSGWHQQSTYPISSVDPTTSASQLAVYSKTVTQPELFIRGQSAGTVIQMSNINFGTSAGNQGYTFLPGGIILLWGDATVNTSGTAVTFTKAFPNNCFQVVVTPESNTARGIAENSISTTGFTAFAANNGTVVHYIAVGN